MMIPSNSEFRTDLSLSEPRVGKSPELRENSSFLGCGTPCIFLPNYYKLQGKQCMQNKGSHRQVDLRIQGQDIYFDSIPENNVYTIR